MKKTADGPASLGSAENAEQPARQEGLQEKVDDAQAEDHRIDGAGSHRLRLITALLAPGREEPGRQVSQEKKLQVPKGEPPPQDLGPKAPRPALPLRRPVAPPRQVRPGHHDRAGTG